MNSTIFKQPRHRVTQHSDVVDARSWGISRQSSSLPQHCGVGRPDTVSQHSGSEMVLVRYIIMAALKAEGIAARMST